MRSFKEFLMESVDRLPIADLIKSQAGLAIVQSSFHNPADIKPNNAGKPIAVTSTPEGHYVLDGYHRMVKAHAEGQTHIDVKHVPYDDHMRERYEYEKKNGHLTKSFNSKDW